MLEERRPPPVRLPRGAYYVLTVLTALNVINLWHRYLIVSVIALRYNRTIVCSCQQRIIVQHQRRDCNLAVHPSLINSAVVVVPHATLLAAACLSSRPAVIARPGLHTYMHTLSDVLVPGIEPEERRKYHTGQALPDI